MLNRVPTLLFLTLIFLSVISTGHGLCSKDEFQCDATKCNNMRLRCDGYINCRDLSDELQCDKKGAKLNVTSLTIPANRTLSTTMSSNLTTSPPTPPNKHNENTKPVSPKNTKEDKYKKNIKKRIYFNNNTKDKKKRPFYNRTPARSPIAIESSIVTTAITTSSEVQTKNVQARPVHCSVEECVRWKTCWRDKERSYECACDEAVCSRGLKTSAHTENEHEMKTKDVFEWVIISVSSTCLIVAIIVLLLKRRRLRQTNTTPLHVRTVVCYHHGHEESARFGRNVYIRDQGKATENRPLCEKARCPSLMAEDEGNVCVIDLTGQLKRNK